MQVSSEIIQFILAASPTPPEVTIDRAEREVRNLHLDFSQRQFNALVSLIASIGLVAFRNSSLRTTLLSRVATPLDIRRGFHWWIRGANDEGHVCILPELIERRRMEAEMFLSGTLIERAGGD
jgi:GH24 family phage-related lysozyme (muramidase)